MGRDLHLAFNGSAVIRGMAMLGCCAALLAGCKPNPLKPAEESRAKPSAVADKGPRKDEPTAPPVVAPISATVTLVENGSEPRRKLSVDAGNKEMWMAYGNVKTVSTTTGMNGVDSKTASLEVTFEARTGLRMSKKDTSMFGVVPQRVTVKADASMEAAKSLEVGKGADQTATAAVEVTRDGRHGGAIYMNGFGPIPRPPAASLISETWMWAAPVFPAEPVGVGAQWQATSFITVSAGVAKRVATFEVVSMTEKAVRLKVTVADRLSELVAKKDNPLKANEYEANVTADWTVNTGDWPGTGTLDVSRTTTYEEDGNLARIAEHTTARFGDRN